MMDEAALAEHAAACAQMMEAMGGAAAAMPMMGAAGMMGADGMMGMGWTAWLVVVFWLLLVFVLVLAAVVLLRSVRRREPIPTEADRLEHELGLRYVRGEIDHETYARIREELSERS